MAAAKPEGEANVTEDMTAALNSVPFKVTEPELISAERYYDPAFFELEKEKSPGFPEIPRQDYSNLPLTSGCLTAIWLDSICSC